MTTSVRTDLGADKLDALALTLRPSWEQHFASQEVAPPTPPTRRTSDAAPAKSLRQESKPVSSRRGAMSKPRASAPVSVPTEKSSMGTIALIVAGVVAVGGIAFMLLRNSEPDPPPRKETPTQAQPPAEQAKPVEQPPPPKEEVKEDVEEPAPPPEPVVETKPTPPPAPIVHAGPRPAPKPPQPGGKMPAPKAGPKPHPKGGIVREVPF